MTRTLSATLLRAFHIHEYELPKYYSALGEFISGFSEIELIVQKLLWHKAEVSQTMGKAVFSGNKVDQCVSIIKRIYEGTGETLEPELDRAFQQLALINKFRNHIVHYGANLMPDVPIVSNKDMALTESRIQEYPVSPELLKDLSDDVQAIHYLIAAILNADLYSPSELQEEKDRFSKRSFLYKFPSQGSGGQKNPKNSHKQLRQPQSSEG